MSVTLRRVIGHGLVAEGAAFSEIGFRCRWNTVAGKGHGMCSCGVVSEQEYPNAAARKRWHRGHKFDEVIAANRTAALAPSPATQPESAASEVGG